MIKKPSFGAFRTIVLLLTKRLQMKNIGLVLPYDYKLLTVAAALDVFETVNNLCAKSKKDIPFKIYILQSSEQIKKTGKTLHGYPVRSIRSNLRLDIILIPSLANPKEALAKNQAYIPWLQKQFKAGSEIASFCTGAFLFAATGLLNGKLATTHADDCPNFIVAFPSVFVKPGRTVTIDERCYTSGGSTSAFHLLVFLVQKHCGNELAVNISKTFAIDLNRYQQSYFSTFRPDHSHHDEMVKKIQKNIEANYLSIHTIEEVIKGLHASRRNIVRRFKKITGIPPIEYLQHIRIEKAKIQLEQTSLNISEIINNTGYNDPKSFRKIFLKLVGISPLDYRDKFKVK
jgi:transcriptional regulator GlxA family with amidase domain